MIITVASIRPPAAGKSRTLITTTDGQRFGCWQDKAPMFRPGASYDVVIEESEHEGRTYQNIKKAAPAASFEKTSGPQAAPVSGPASAPAAAAAFRTPEQMFVTEVLTAYIANGRCAPEKLADTIGYIRRAWGRTFGDAPITGYREAAE